MSGVVLETRVVEIRDPAQSPDAVRLAAGIIRNGGLVALPTETVYGIAANALDPAAVERIFEAKGRPQDNPLIVHIAAIGELRPLVRELPPEAMRLAEAFWPGPLTVVLPKSDIIPAVVSGGLDTVAIRMPSHPVARAIIRESGVPVAAPSANRSGSPSTTTAEHCIDDLSGRVELIVDGGPCQVGIESTVISLAGPKPRLLRPGAITLEQLYGELGPVEVDPAVQGRADPDEPVSSPGMKYTHYAPKAQVILVHGSLEKYSAYVARRAEDGVFGLVFSSDTARVPIPCLSYGDQTNPGEQARMLFSALRALDEMGARRVYARAPSPTGLGLAVYNRLIRAAGFEQVKL